MLVNKNQTFSKGGVHRESCIAEFDKRQNRTVLRDIKSSKISFRNAVVLPSMLDARISFEKR